MVPNDTSALDLDAGPVSPFDVEQVARHGRPIALGDAGRARMAAAADTLTDAIARGRAIYGVNTGFGSLSRVRVGADQLRAIQENLVRSHAAGAGSALPTDIVRAMMVCLAASLARGHSGVRPALVDAIAALVNAGVTPVVPEHGSVGASGDLAPLAHVAEVLLGEGRAVHGGKEIRGAEALRIAGVAPVELGAKEGLALLNGTHLMAGEAALIAQDARRVVDAALAATALSIDACRATDAFLDPRVYEARNHAGPARVAARIREMLKDSQIVASHREDDPRVQDPYSLRCAPIVLGSCIDALEWVRHKIESELGAVTDNPLVFPGTEGEPVVSAGNFHGMPIALPLDVLSVALAPLAGIAERRVYFMLSASDPEAHLRAHLSAHPGVESGLMVTQYTAAACCNEMAGLANPACVVNIPTCAGMEDFNSFGPRSAAKARRAVELARRVVAIELLVACEAMEYHRPLRSGQGVERTHAAVREVVARLTADRSPAPDIARIEGLVRGGRFG
jgi:histidine ammonia-lyase